MAVIYSLLLLTAMVAVISSLAHGSDPDMLQDYCVAVNDSMPHVYVNGLICKDSETVTSDDFLYSGGLDKPGIITSPLGSRATQVFVDSFPALNTQGISTARLDFAPRGVNPPHHHPRATELLTVLKGTLYVGFISSNPSDPNRRNRLFDKILHPGDVYLFPKGLIHFQYNVGKENAVAFVGFNSQNPGVVTTGRALYGSEPHVWPEVLAKGLQLSKEEVKRLQALPYGWGTTSFIISNLQPGYQRPSWPWDTISH